MPFYNYKCIKCEHEDEMLEPMDDDGLKVCPGCGEEQFQRMLSAPTIHFRTIYKGKYISDKKS